MRPWKASRKILMMTAVIAASAVVLACPLIMVAHAQMSHMMSHNVPSLSLEGMCPLSCGVPPDPTGVASIGFALGPLPVHLAFNLASTIQPVFHPPNLT